MFPLGELGASVDPATLGVLVAFWVRWEVWRNAHDKKHKAIDLHLPQEAPSHA